MESRASSFAVLKTSDRRFLMILTFQISFFGWLGVISVSCVSNHLGFSQTSIALSLSQLRFCRLASFAQILAFLNHPCAVCSKCWSLWNQNFRKRCQDQLLVVFRRIFECCNLCDSKLGQRVFSLLLDNHSPQYFFSDWISLVSSIKNWRLLKTYFCWETPGFTSRMPAIKT